MKKLTRTLISVLLLLSMLLSMTGCDMEGFTLKKGFALVKMIVQLIVDGGPAEQEPKPMQDMYHIHWEQYAYSDNTGYHLIAYPETDGSIAYQHEDSWSTLYFDGVDHTMTYQYHHWGDAGNDTGKYTISDVETHLFSFTQSNEPEKGVMYDGCENTEWYYPLQYAGPEIYSMGVSDEYGEILPEYAQFFNADGGFWQNTESEDWPFLIDGSYWMRVTRVGDRLELAIYRTGDTEPREIRYFYDPETGVLPNGTSAEDTADAETDAA